MCVWKLVIIKGLPKQLRNTKERAGDSIPIKRLDKQPLSVITCCLREAGEWDKLTLNSPFLFKTVGQLFWLKKSHLSA